MLWNQSERPTSRHDTALSLAWAGGMFDLSDLVLCSFLLVPIKRSLGLSDAQLALLLGGHNGHGSKAVTHA